MFNILESIKENKPHVILENETIRVNYDINVKKYFENDFQQLREDLQNLHKLLGNDFNIYVDENYVTITLI